MSSSSARVANSATDGRAGPIGASVSGVTAGAVGAPGVTVPGRVVTSPRGATDPSGAVVPPARSGARVATGGGGETSAVTVRFSHPATSVAGTSIETARTQSCRFFMIPPGCRRLLRLLGVYEREALYATPEPAESAQGDADPTRTMVDLIPDLVERLVQLERGQGPLERGSGRRKEPHGRLRHGLDVRVEEDARREPAPRLARRGEFVRRSERGGGRIVEWAQHARHVREGRLFRPPLRRRPGRLALEVEEHEAVVGAERLAEVIVAVDPNL